jgi:hypothetical protein
MQHIAKPCLRRKLTTLVFRGSVSHLDLIGLFHLNIVQDVHLSDLSDILRKHPVVQVGGDEVINFTKCVDLAACMGNLLQIKVPYFGEASNHRKLVSLSNLIRQTVLNDQVKKELDNLSLLQKLAEIELMARVKRNRTFVTP